MELPVEWDLPANLLERIASQDYYVTCRMRCVNKVWRQAVKEARPIKLSCDWPTLSEVVQALAIRPSNSCVQEVKLCMESIGLPLATMLAVRFPDLQVLDLMAAGSTFDHKAHEALSYLPIRLKCLRLEFQVVVTKPRKELNLPVFDRMSCLESLSIHCTGMDDNSNFLMTGDLTAPCLSEISLSVDCESSSLVLPGFTATQIGLNCVFDIESCLVPSAVLAHPCASGVRGKEYRLPEFVPVYGGMVFVCIRQKGHGCQQE